MGRLQKEDKPIEHRPPTLGSADNVAKAFDAGILFAFFCAMMCLQLIWVKLMVPETKGVPLEEMQKKLGIE